MSFFQDNFLGSFAGAGDTAAAIAALDDKVFYKDGSRSMEGPISMVGNTIIGAETLQVNELAVGVLPPTGQLSIYSLASDKKLYIQDDAGLETELASGGDVDGPASATDDALAVYDGTTGKLLKDSSITVGATGVDLIIPQGGGVIFTESKGPATESVEITAGSMAASYTVVLPTAAPTAGDCFTNFSGDNAVWSARVEFDASNGTPAVLNLIPVFEDLTGDKIEAQQFIGIDITTGNFERLTSPWITTTGTSTGWGIDSLISITTSTNNYSAGDSSGENLATGIGRNVLLGVDCGKGAVAASFSNILAAGHSCAENMTTSIESVYLGDGAAINTTSGSRNTFVGYISGQDNIIGNDSVGAGHRSLENLTGSNCIGIGKSAGDALVASDDCICIGNTGVVADSGVIRLGNGTDHTSCFIAGVGSVTPGGTPEVVVMDPVTGELGTDQISGDLVTSSAGSNDHRIARFDGATGNIIQNSSLGIEDDGTIQFTGTDYIHIKGGVDNFSAGLRAGTAVTTCTTSTFLGENCGASILTGNSNLMAGSNCCLLASNMINNTFLGNNIASVNVNSGGSNTATGNESMKNITTAFGNCAYGHQSMELAESSFTSCAYGNDSLSSCVDGDNNNCFGSQSGTNILLDNNLMVANDGLAGDDSTIRIGNSTDHTSCFIAGIDGGTSPGGILQTVTCDADGRLVADVNHLPPEYISGMKLSYSSITTTNVLAGHCRDTDNEANIALTGITAVVITTAGAGGLMTGESEAADTTYELWAMHDDDHINADNAFMVTEGVTPAEIGYTHFRYLGAVRNSSSDLLNFYMTGKGALRNVWYYDSFSTLLVLNNGSATTWTTMSGAVDAVNDLAPTGAGSVVLNVHFEADVGLDDNVRFRPEGDAGDFIDCYIIQTGEDQDLGSDAYSQIQVPLATSRDIEYEVSDAGLDIDVAVVGYSIEL